MRTVATIWTAALALVSLTGPFTTAEAAPARLSDSDRRIRPVFRNRSFNETDANLELRDPHPILGVSIPPVSLPLPGPTEPPHPKHHDHRRPKHDHVTAQRLSSSSFAASSSPGLLAGHHTRLHHTPPLLGTGGLGGLTTVLPGVTSDLHSVVSHLTGTGGIGGALTSVVSDATQAAGTGAVSSVLSDATHAIPTGGVQSIVSDVTNGVGKATSKLAGITGTGTGDLLPDVTGQAGSILSSVKSEVTSVVSSLESATTLLPAQITQPVASIESSLISELSQISLTATAPGLVSVLSSGFSSILSGVTPPVGTLLPSVSGPIGSLLSSPTAQIGSILTNPTGFVGSVLPSITGSIQSIVPSIPSTLIPPIITSPLGTGGIIPTSDLPIPTGGITITGPGTTVVVPIPTQTPGTGVDTTGTVVGLTTGPTVSPTPTTTTPQGTGVPVTPSGSISSTPVSTITKSEGATSSSDTATTNTAIPPTTTGTFRHLNATQNGPQSSIQATGTDTRTTVSLPTKWTFAGPSSGSTATKTLLQTASSAPQSTSAGIAPFLPSLVQPASGMPDPGTNFSLIQIGFKYGLNYPFVVGAPESSMQIMAYLPKGISHGLAIEEDQVLMNALMPLNTQPQLGYVTTLAQVYIPKDLVNQLQLSIHTSSSPIYYNDKIPVQELMRMINPTIPILPGSSYDGLGAYGGFDGKAAAGAGPGSGDGAPIGSDAGTIKKVQNTSVGIAGAAVAGAAVYVASMMYVARRYRQRRKRHQRVSSVPTMGQMTQRSSGGMGSLFMTGANGRGSTRGSMTIPGVRGSRTSNGSSNGRSIREQGISAPLMSENSLGWN